MKRNDDKQEQFVLHYYQPQKLDTQKAIEAFHQRTGQPRGRSPLRNIAAAAVTLTLLSVTAYALFFTSSGTPESLPDSHREQPPAPTVAVPPRHFHYDDTPINDVLRDLSDYYGVELSTNDSTKHLSGDFDADGIDDIVTIIEQALGIHIDTEP